MKKYICFILVVIWAGIIYYASSKTSIESNSKSKEIIYETTSQAAEVTSKIQSKKIDPKDEVQYWRIADKWNKPLRKSMHVIEFSVLGILLVLLISNYNLSWKKVLILTVFICFFYSLTDEYHQTQVTGRNGQLSDSIIDTTGGLIGSSIMLFKLNRKGKK